MSEQRVPITVIGKKRLDDELKVLITIERPSVIKAIATARAHGDLSENADYSAAKERQGFIEGRIQELSDKLSRCDVIDPRTLKSDKIVFGATVLLEEGASGKEVRYQVVGVDETDVKAGRIGVTSPIGRALIGRKKGDEVVVDAPKGKLEYTVLDICYE